MKSIRNGGLELGIFNIVGDENLSDADKERKAYLESLPKDKWITLDENGIAVTDQQAKEIAERGLAKYRVQSNVL